MKYFKLPDLGEGLHEAEIVSWHVQEGEEVQSGVPLVSVETAKAIVEIPSPYTGRIEKLFGKTGDIVHLNAPLVGFAGSSEEEDAGTVVGSVPKGGHAADLGTGNGTGGIKAMPAARSLARRLNVDLAAVTPTGPDGSITAGDVQRAATQNSELPAQEPLRGVRRAMAQNIASARSEVASVTVTDDADINAWTGVSDITIRLVRAIVAGCRVEPVLNAWYDGAAMARRVFKKIDLGIAVDIPEGLFVPVLRDVGNRDAVDLRRALDRMRADVKARKIPPEEMRGCTITLSNFGMIAGKYASPMVLPPTVAIIGAGRVFNRVVIENGAPAEHRMLPLSLSFDHRAAAGGEAARFLGAMIADLEKAS